MTKDEEAQMALYGIRAEHKRVFRYMNYQYEHLEDALNYARIDSGRQKGSGYSELEA